MISLGHSTLIGNRSVLLIRSVLVFIFYPEMPISANKNILQNKNQPDAHPENRPQSPIDKRNSEQQNQKYYGGYLSLHDFCRLIIRHLQAFFIDQQPEANGSPAGCLLFAADGNPVHAAHEGFGVGNPHSVPFQGCLLPA